MAGTDLALSVADPALTPTTLATGDMLGLLAVGLAAGAFVSFFEELGWTGFALPRLRDRHGPLATGLLMDLLWGVWHFPFFSGTTDPAGVVPQAVLVAVLLFAWLPAYRVLMVWVHDRTASLPVAILMHVPVVACQYVLANDVTGAGLAVGLIAWGASFWLIALVVARPSFRPLASARHGPRRALDALRRTTPTRVDTV